MTLFFGKKATITGTPSSGTITYLNGGYIIHQFTSTTTITLDGSILADILLVGGGGGGGGDPASGGGTGGGAGGGGAGATLFRRFVSIASGTPYTLTVGSGGPAGTRPSPGTALPGTNGGTTTAFGSSAAGGGAGGGNSPGAAQSSPLASGGGGMGGAGTGAGTIGVGFPGNNVGTAPGNPMYGAGGGAGGTATGVAGPSPLGASVAVGGPGVPISYFTQNPADFASVGGPGNHPSNPVNSTYVTSPFVGSGGKGAQSGRNGSVFIRYL